MCIGDICCTVYAADKSILDSTTKQTCTLRSVPNKVAPNVYGSLQYYLRMLKILSLFYLRECAEMILKFHQSAQLGQLKVTYEKYMKSDFSAVAAVKPLEKLPP